MKPLRIQAENYRTFETLDLTLTDGCLAVVGENGAGKSSIVNAIDLCLFAARGELAAQRSDTDAGDLLLALEFEHAGDLYRIRRGYSAKGRSGKTTLDFERLARDEADVAGNYTEREAWEPLTRDKADETQARIQEVIGLSRETFRASAFLAQGDGAAFTEAAPKDRKRILAEVLGLDVYDRLLEQVKVELRAAGDELTRLDGATETMRPIAADREQADVALNAAIAAVVASQEQVTAREKELADLTDQWHKAQEKRKDLEQARTEERAAIADRDRLDAIRVAAEAAAGQVATVEGELERLKPLANGLDVMEKLVTDLQAKVDRHALAVSEHDAAKREHALKLTQRNGILAQASDLNEKAMRLRGEADELEKTGPGEAHCERCKQTLGAEALASSLAAMRTEADDLDAAAKDLDAQANEITLPEVGEPPAGEAPTAALQIAQQKLRDGREADVQIRVLNERLGNLRQTVAAGDDETYKAELAAAEKQVTLVTEKIAKLAELAPRDSDLETLKAKGISVKGALELARTEQTSAAGDKARAEARVARVVEAEEKLAEGTTRREELQNEIDLLSALERAYGRDGIPALIVENAAIPAIELEASRILAELGGNTAECRIELRTQAELKSGEGLRDTLDIVIVGPASERPYETYSGGERTRLNLALRIALARLLAHRRGAESRVLVIDEPEFLDEQGVAKLADVLRGLLDDFDKVILISHVPTLRESFDETLTVVNEGGVSRVDEGALAVAA